MAKYVKDTKAAIQNVGRAAKLWSKMTSRKSVSRVANDSIFKYPLIASADIEVNELLTLAKGKERLIAAMIVSQISLDNAVDLDKYGSVQNWLKTIHNNSDIPANIVTMVENAVESTTLTRDELLSIAIECWSDMYLDECLDTSTINDMYKPYNETKAIIKDGIALATEAKKNSYRDPVHNEPDNAPMFGIGHGSNDPNKAVVDPINNPIRAAHVTARNMYDKMNPDNSYDINQRANRQAEKRDDKSYAIVKDGESSSMSPTMINVDLFCYNPKNGKGSDGFHVKAVIGVKSMVRRVVSDAMVSNLIDGVRGSNAIFDFIKFTNGEANAFLHFISTPFRRGKEAAIGKNSGDRGFVKALQRRKFFNGVSKVMDNPVPPHTCIMMTTYECARVKEITGIDLMDEYYAMKMMNKYYILSLDIYDTESKTLLSMFDGDAEWSTNTLYSIGIANKSMVNYANMAETMDKYNRR